MTFRLWIGLIALAIGLLPIKDSLAATTKPLRLISLSPSITEALFELERGDWLVGTSEYSNHPEAAKKIPRVGAYTSPSIEKIVSLKPDLVLLPSEGVDTITTALKQAGLEFIALKMRTLADFPAALKTLAQATGRSERASDLIETWKQGIAEVKKVYSPKRVLIQIDHDPLIVAGGDTFLSEGLKLCGVQNVFENELGYPQIGAESLHTHTPEAAVLVAEFSEPGKLERTKAFWDETPLNPKPYLLVRDPDDLSRLSVRLPDAIAALCRDLKGGVRP